MIEPFFFDNARLFGCYHAAEEWPAPRLLIVCPPLFDEYRRCYRALSELATACSQQNVHVVRFDYFGTGESQGELSDATLNVWLQDIHTAIEEGLAISGAEEVVLMGVRFGATLAAQTNHSAVKRRIFWDPVESGREYLDWLNQVNESLTKEHLNIVRAVNLSLDNCEYENFSISSQLRSDVTDLLFDSEKVLAEENSFIVSTDRLKASETNRGNFEYANFDYDWPEYHDGVLVPAPVLESIAHKVLQQ